MSGKDHKEKSGEHRTGARPIARNPTAGEHAKDADQEQACDETTGARRLSGGEGRPWGSKQEGPAADSRPSSADAAYIATAYANAAGGTTIAAAGGSRGAETLAATARGAAKRVVRGAEARRTRCSGEAWAWAVAVRAAA